MTVGIADLIFMLYSSDKDFIIYVGLFALIFAIIQFVPALFYIPVPVKKNRFFWLYIALSLVIIITTKVIYSYTPFVDEHIYVQTMLCMGIIMAHFYILVSYKLLKEEKARKIE